MVRTGEIPGHESHRAQSLDLGMPVFDQAGNELGRLRGIHKDGFFVTTRDGIESMSVQHLRAGGTFGEAELMWRCTVCGEMGEIGDALPSSCPNCDTEREDLMYWTED